MYRRTGSQLVLKLKKNEPIRKILGDIRRTLPAIIAQAENAEERDIVKPLVTTTSLGWSRECDRVLAKIGINFVAHEAGLDAARHPDLKKAKIFISGKSDTHRTAFLDKNIMQQAFGDVPSGKHCVLLSHSQAGGRCRAVISFHLYGGLGLTMILADDLPEKTPPSLTYYLIDYASNVITKHEFFDYQRKFNRDYVLSYGEELGVATSRFAHRLEKGSLTPPEL